MIDGKEPPLAFSQKGDAGNVMYCCRGCGKYFNVALVKSEMQRWLAGHPFDTAVKTLSPEDRKSLTEKKCTDCRNKV